MAECSQLGFELPGFSGRNIEGNFEGGNVSSDGGLVLLRQVDRWIGLSKSLSKRLPDKRDPDKIEHSLESMLRQLRTSQLLDTVPVRESSWAQRSLADARGALRTVRGQLRVGSLDFDCTDDRVHGLQEGRPFHGYYCDFCFLPLYG